MKSCVPRGAVKFDMNAFFIICAAAVLAIVPIPALQLVLATAASTLFESTPFILAGVLLAGIAPRRGLKVASFLGCGCSGGPGALAFPVFAATLFSLGPYVAVLRWLAALGVACARKSADGTHSHPAAGSELLALLPFAMASGALLGALPAHLIREAPPLVAALGVALICFICAPCGFGAIALAVTLHRVAPVAAIAAMSIAGVCDLRALRIARKKAPAHDSLAYAIASLACLLLAWHHGNTLVNPRFVIPLFASGAVLAWLAYRHRTERGAALRTAPTLMLVLSILSAPPPVYYASETTLADAFAGESLDFRGAIAKSNGTTSLVRYAVTCCRADAQPVSVRLASRLSEPAGQWIHAQGRLVRTDDGLDLGITRYEREPAPADPFLYR
jgi:hypothetical protein